MWSQRRKFVLLQNVKYLQNSLKWEVNRMNWNTADNWVKKKVIEQLIHFLLQVFLLVSCSIYSKFITNLYGKTLSCILDYKEIHNFSNHER